MEERVRSRSEIRQYLSGSFLGRGPEGDVVATAKGDMNWEALPKLGESPLLDKDEMEYYVTEYARHGMNGPLNWYRNREVNFVDDYEFFFRRGERVGAKLLDGSGGGKRTDVVPTVEQEVLFILAREDEALPPSMSEEMGKYIPRLTRVEADCGHWALWERAAEVNSFVGTWLEEKVFAA